VRVPQNLPSGFWIGRPHIQLPRSKWAQFGVTIRTDARCRTTICRPRCCCRWADGTGVSGLSQFRGYTEWNNSLIYSTTRVSRTASPRASDAHPAAPVAQLPFAELREMQQLLVRAGFNVGKVDGVMGQQSRTAVKAMQIKYGCRPILPPRIAGADARAAARAVASAESSPFARQCTPTTNPESPINRKSTVCPSTKLPFRLLQILNSLRAPHQAETHCKAKNIQPTFAWRTAFPDMLPLSRQIHLPAISPPKAARA